MEPIIEAYAISFKRLADLDRDLLKALRCLMMHIIAILAFPVYFLAITFCTIVMTLMGVAPRQDAPQQDAPQQDFPHHPFAPTQTSPTLSAVDVDSTSNEFISNSDLITINQVGGISQVGGWLGKIPDGRVKSASVGHPRTISSNPPPASSSYLSDPPAISPHLKDCEFYYNDLDEEPLENSAMLNDGGQPIVHITVDGVSQIYLPGDARTFLQNLENKRTVTFNDAGGFDRGEGKRGKLEMRNRVYVGPVQWLLRVLIEEV